MNENNVRTLDFGPSGDEPARAMPEDVFEGGAPADFDFDNAVEQFNLDNGDGGEIGTLVTADFTPPEEEEPLTAAELHQSAPFIYIQIPSLGIAVPLDIPTATSLFDSLGAAINGL